LIVDPTQSVVVFVPYYHECRSSSSGEVVLVIRIAALVGYMTLSQTGQRIPWDCWKRDVMVVEIPPYDVFYIRTFVLGSRVLLVTDDWRENPGGYSIRAYDFSRWGCRALVRAGNGEDERRVMPDPKEMPFPREHSNGIKNLRSLGDSLVSCVVSDFQEILGLIEGLRLVREGCGVS
jgi:hypothetical protein